MSSSPASGAEAARRDRRARALSCAAGALAILALAAGGYAATTYAGYRDARARWQEMSERVVGDGYDAAESDRRYLAVETHEEGLWQGLRAMALGAAGALGALLARRRILTRR